MATPTVADLWNDYAPVSRRDNDTHATERGRAAHLIRHMGARPASALSLADIDKYRGARLEELTVRGAPPAPATLDREVELLKRLLNYAVSCRRLYSNPLAGVKLLAKCNVRRSIITEPVFQALLEASPVHLRPILLVAFDTGMRQREILDLRWDQTDLVEGCINLEAEATKGEEARKVYLTRRVLEALGGIAPDGPWVFTNPDTRRPWQDIRKVFGSACEAAGRPELWFHDLRRSFVVKARRRGIAQSVVMRMSGHKTDSVFRRYNIIEDKDVQDAARLLDD